jgi:hypothetical protein
VKTGPAIRPVRAECLSLAIILGWALVAHGLMASVA